MLFDERIASLIQQRYELVVQSIGADIFYEALRYVRWLAEEDFTRPYLLHVLQSDEAERAAYAEHLKTIRADAITVRAALGRLLPLVEGEPGATDDDDFDAHGLPRFDFLASQVPDWEEEEDRIQREPDNDPSCVGRLLQILARVATSYPDEGAFNEFTNVGYQIGNLIGRHKFRFAERSNRIRTSPATSLRKVLEILRALAPPPDDLSDWMPFLPMNHARTFVLAHGRAARPGTSHNDADEQARDLRGGLARVQSELLTNLGTSLSSETLVLRFKERCTWYDRAEMRALSADNARGGKREDRLTLAMAKYIHDCGVFVLVRPRVANLEPDVMSPPLGTRRFALESKVYDRGESPLTCVKKGFWQLHAYLTSLETNATRTKEGFLVIFRLGGALCETPPTVSTGRFLIHIVTIDIGLGVDSGHAQPKPVRVREHELLEVLANEDEPSS